MEQQHAADDHSHYEVSLTAGQAFVAFVLLLLSLAASFAFGLMLGKGQADERLVVRKETPVVTEASLARTQSDGRIVEMGVAVDDFEGEGEIDEAVPAVVTETATVTSADTAAAPVETPAPAVTDEQAAVPVPVTRPDSETPRTGEPEPARVETQPVESVHPAVVHYAQLLSTQDQKTAETLAVRLINGGFKSAYVERGATDKGPVFRVRVRFPSESAARSAESKLKAYSKEVWITAK